MMNNLIRNLTLTTTLLSGAVLAGPLSVTVYNPGEKAIFPVSSSLVAGDKEAILIDAQFDVQNGQALVDMHLCWHAPSPSASSSARPPRWNRATSPTPPSGDPLASPTVRSPRAHP